MATDPAPPGNNAKQVIGNAVKMAQDYELNNQERVRQRDVRLDLHNDND